jgi:citrate synthase
MTDTSKPTPSIRTRAGVVLLGQQVVVHGKDLHHDCLELGFVHYLLFAVTGRTFDPVQVRVLEQLWIATGYADSRIWCNRIAGYLGSARADAGYALSACIAATNSTVYGFRSMRRAYAIQAALPVEKEQRRAWLEAELAQDSTIYGYGRPIHGHDERIAVALHSLASAGLRAGPALQRAFWLHRRLLEKKGIEINIAAIWAAIALDFEIGAEEFESFMLLLFAPGYLAVFAEQRALPELSFLRGYHSPV